MMKIRSIHLPVFAPNRFERATVIQFSGESIWSVSADTTYQYNTMSEPVVIKAGMIRGTTHGVTTVTFAEEVMVEIQE